MQEYVNFFVSEWPLFLALAVILGLLARAFMTGAKSVGPMEAVSLINRQDAVIVDVRTDKEYDEGHVTNSLHIPYGVLADRLADLQKYKERPIILACRSGARSGQAVSILTKQGFEKVYNLAGGVLAWGNANLPISSGRNDGKDNGKEKARRKKKQAAS